MLDRGNVSLLGWAFGFEPVCVVLQRMVLLTSVLFLPYLWQSDVVEFHNFCIFQHTSRTMEEVIEKYISHVKASN